MNKNSVIRYWKDPVYRSKLPEEMKANMLENPIGDSLKGLSDLEKSSIAGGVNAQSTGTTTKAALCTFTDCGTVSKLGGNDGWYCTLTVECMPSCN
ncbi:plantaricin C family lantibiotic [Paenactinomyces guangxiensis]|uniref:Plantaricin C family lantibiotic n=1 Tax=Paenactinomyces guangxiensis TaxID=1490290 RepID=A0A7W1WMN6_9BACL|nr:plantaricin C family lantibiotic [Paenactinomyces guangxiensis]MBA4492714.1 plantaricin C family lantibiotic [Paenactinomyces guangxiensis]MBH8590438.1 plantaricin C family lantibiotic [Paenactinomyces guangxiensis]